MFGGHFVILEMKRIGLKKCGLWISLIGNVLLLAVIIFIGCVKPDYINSKLERLGVMKIDPVKRGDYWSIQGWTNTLEKLHLDMDVVFFGNSITRGSCFEEYFPNVKICNLGYPGDNTDGMLLRVKQIKVVNPEKVFVMAGINGLHIQTEKVFTEKYATMVDSIKQVVPTAKIYLQSILPVNPSMKAGKVFNKEKIARCNELVQKIAAQKGCVYIDLYKLYEVDGIMPKELTRDGVHLRPEAYDRWAKEIKKYIEE